MIHKLINETGGRFEVEVRDDWGTVIIISEAGSVVYAVTMPLEEARALWVKARKTGFNKA